MGFFIRKDVGTCFRMFFVLRVFVFHGHFLLMVEYSYFKVTSVN